MLFLSTEKDPKEQESISVEEKQLAIAAMPRKDRRLYEKIMHSQKKKQKEVNTKHLIRILLKILMCR